MIHPVTEFLCETKAPVSQNIINLNDTESKITIAENYNNRIRKIVFTNIQ